MIEEFLAACEEFASYPQDIVWGEIDLDGFSYIDTITRGSGRWMEYKWSVFDHDGQYIAVEWASGLTEDQEDEVEISRFNVFEVQPFDFIKISFRKV